MSESFNFPIRIPENSESFIDWEKRHEARLVDEPATNPSPAIEAQEPIVQIPENGESFKDWLHRYYSQYDSDVQ